MSDSLGTLLLVLPILALYLAWKFLLERPVRRLFTPPSGGWLLFGTWGLAFSLIPVALSLRSTHPYVGLAAATLPIPLALFLTLVYRDQRHVVEGRDPVTASIPRQLGRLSRLFWGMLGVVTTGLMVYLLITPNRDWDAILALGSLSGTLLGIFWKGTVPQSVRESLGAPPDDQPRLDAG